MSDFEIFYIRSDPKEFFGTPYTIHSNDPDKLRSVSHIFYKGSSLNSDGIRRMTVAYYPLSELGRVRVMLTTRLNGSRLLLEEIKS